MVDSSFEKDDITDLLRHVAGEDGEQDQAIELLYAKLRQIGRKMMQSERRQHTLQATALVNEAWLKLTAGQPQTYQDREHFLSVAARAMRQILLDHARARMTKRRTAGPEEAQALGEKMSTAAPGIDLLALDEAMARLASRDARLAKIVELRCFAGLDVEETAQALNLSPTTVKREWRIARTLLLKDLE